MGDGDLAEKHYNVPVVSRAAAKEVGEGGLDRRQEPVRQPRRRSGTVSSRLAPCLVDLHRVYRSVHRVYIDLHRVYIDLHRVYRSVHPINVVRHLDVLPTCFKFVLINFKL